LNKLLLTVKHSVKVSGLKVKPLGKHFMTFPLSPYIQKCNTIQIGPVSKLDYKTKKLT